QADDGLLAGLWTGVQTCALPIYSWASGSLSGESLTRCGRLVELRELTLSKDSGLDRLGDLAAADWPHLERFHLTLSQADTDVLSSEERRGGEGGEGMGSATQGHT